jgi:hypothetical protein
MTQTWVFIGQLGQGAAAEAFACSAPAMDRVARIACLTSRRLYAICYAA